MGTLESAEANRRRAAQALGDCGVRASAQHARDARVPEGVQAVDTGIEADALDDAAHTAPVVARWTVEPYEALGPYLLNCDFSAQGFKDFGALDGVPHMPSRIGK